MFYGLRQVIFIQIAIIRARDFLWRAVKKNQRTTEKRPFARRRQMHKSRYNRNQPVSKVVIYCCAVQFIQLVPTYHLHQMISRCFVIAKSRALKSKPKQTKKNNHNNSRISAHLASHFHLRHAQHGQMNWLPAQSIK